jgi:solute carrier family 25 protein 39/40
MEVLKANALSGAAAGALAAGITTPFDVAKTRMQLYPAKTKFKTFCVMKDVVFDQGFGGLFKGWSARSAKAIPACAIVLSSYEMIKFFPFFES